MTGMCETRNEYRILGDKPLRKRLLGRPRRREEKIKMEFWEVRWMKLAQGHIQ